MSTTTAPETAATHLDEFHGYYLEDLAVGLVSSYAKTVTETDIILYAGISGDVNPIHLNQEFAADTRFGKTIAHGMLSAGFISTVLGTRLPGPGCDFTRSTQPATCPIWSPRPNSIASCRNLWPQRPPIDRPA